MSKIVYKHIRLDTDEIFYIGIGKSKKRAYSKKSRNNYWDNIVKAHGYKVEIICDVETWEEACSIEKYLIKYYGRKDLGLGNLVNMTNGGDGTEVLSPSHKKAIIQSNKTRIYSKETKEKLSKNCRNFGSKNGMFGTSRILSENPNAKIVLDTVNGIFYSSLKEVALLNNINYTNLVKQLCGQNKNKTNYIYV